MQPYPSEQKRPRQKDPGSGLQRFLFVLILLSLTVMVICLLVIAQVWRSSQTTGQHQTPTPVVTITPHSTATPITTPTPNASL
ncbi:MAG: hypothetical protein ACXWPG_01040, partial [Ktedonobacteraceae bacterium]